MNCDDVREKLLDYVYGELDADAARAVEDHAQGCEACAAELKGLSATLVSTRSALQGPLDQRPPARVAARVRRHAARRAVVPWPTALLRACLRWLQRPLLLPVLCAAAVAVLGITLRIRSRSDLRERYALAPDASPAVRPVEPSPSAEPPAARDSPLVAERSPEAAAPAASAPPAANTAPSASAGEAKTGEANPGEMKTGEAFATREYAAAPPARRVRGPRSGGAHTAPADAASVGSSTDAMRRSDELGTSSGRRTAPQPLARNRPAAARKASRLALRVDDAPLVADAAKPQASAATSSTLQAELDVEPATPSAAASADVEGVAEPAPPSSAESSAAPAPALRPLLQRAERAFRNKRWGTAAAAYQQLLRSYPAHRSAPVWQRRLSVAETALQGR